jgi:holo-[acyl-carrier protein] synthase
VIVGTGIDIVRVERIENSLSRWGEKFAVKILTSDELERFGSIDSGQAGYLARQFAAKEAVSKALGTGMGAGIHFSQIEIDRKPSGAPIVRLQGKAFERSEYLSILHWHVSISDEKEFVVAFSIAEK